MKLTNRSTMFAKLFVAILSIVLTANVFAGWGIRISPEKKEDLLNRYSRPERVSMTYYDNDSGYKTLSDGLKHLKSQGKIDQLYVIYPYSLTESVIFQKELIAAFKELTPKEWAEAEKSSGNIDNPKIQPLWKHLTTAFLHTSLAKSISKELADFNIEVTGFGAEKLSYEKKGQMRMIQGIFSIGVRSKKAEQGGVTNR